MGAFRVVDFILPLLIAAILGGEAIKPGAGIIGFGHVAGLSLFALMQAEYFRALFGPWAPWALWGGLGLMVLSGLGLWLVGWAARVPMWLQAPVPNSPRIYVRGESERPDDLNLRRARERRDRERRSRRALRRRRRA